MLKKTIFIIFILVLMIGSKTILANYDNSVVYLQSQNQNAWISQGLVANGVQNPDISYVDTSTTDLMTAIKNMLVLSAVNSTDYDSINSLLSVIDSQKSNGQLGSESLLNDDFWGLLALSAVNQTDNDIKNFILAHQNQDGGWSWSATGQSDTNDTSAAIMALLDNGLSASSDQIVSALGYLASAQNDDGGFGYDLASDSDGASTAWVITALNKAGIEASSWQKGDTNPILFLQGLETADGSFLWLPSDEQGSAMVTAYSLVALNNKYYPINRINLPEDSPQLTGHNLRIEGPDSTVCLATNLEANTVLDLLEIGSQACGFDYITQNTDYGLYVSSIDGIESSGMDGWQYWVDWQSGTVAVDEMELSENQNVLWAYGGFPFYPTKLELDSNQVEIDQSFTAIANYYDANNWLPLADANISVNGQSYTTDQNGQVVISINQSGLYPIYTNQADGFVRSNKVYIQVGDGISQTVDLTVNILSSGGGDEENQVAFSVSQSSVDFGDLRAGQSAETILTLTNTGNVEIYVEASILGDNIFINNTTLDNYVWEDFSTLLGTNSNFPVSIQLSLPNNLSSSGQKDGQLIFWATNNQ